MTATLTDRRSELRTLASQWDERGHVVRELALTRMAHPSLLEPWALVGLWESYLGALRVALAFEHQEAWVTPQHVDEQLTGLGAWDAAVDEAWRRVEAAEDLILNGTARGRGMGD